LRAQKHAEATRVSATESEYTAATLALRSAETRRDSALAEVGALRAENERLGDRLAPAFAKSLWLVKPPADSSYAHCVLLFALRGCDVGALHQDNDRLSRLLERESRRADEADGRLRVASEQLSWAIPQVSLESQPSVGPLLF
jgi:hypothetical protein